MELINDFSVGLFFWQTLLFVGLIFILKKYAWKPILDAIQEREDHIEGSLESAKKAKEEVAQLKADNDKVLKEARAERDQLLKEARDTKESIINEAKGQANAEAEKIVAQAREAIQNEKMAAVTELKNQIADIAIQVSEKMVGEKLATNTAQEELIDKLLQEVK